MLDGRPKRGVVRFIWPTIRRCKKDSASGALTISIVPYNSEREVADGLLRERASSMTFRPDLVS